MGVWRKESPRTAATTNVKTRRITHFRVLSAAK
jgi:hypothetical protein